MQRKINDYRTDSTLARCIQGNQTRANGPYYYLDDLHCMDAPQMIPSGSMASFQITATGETLFFQTAVRRDA